MKSLINLSEDISSKKISAARVVVLVIFVIVMLVCSVLVTTLEQGSMASSAMTIISMAAFMAALIMSFFLKQEVLKQDGSTFECKTIDFHDSKYAVVKSAVAGGDWNLLASIAQGGTGSIMKLEVVFSKNKGFAAYQFFRYVPHSYQPCSEIYYVDAEDVVKLNLEVWA